MDLPRGTAREHRQHQLARTVAGGAEGTWRLLHLRRELPLTRFRVRIIGEEVTVKDAKARQELGYQATVSRVESFLAMTQAAASSGSGRRSS
jgi:hypothetical protein